MKRVEEEKVVKELKYYEAVDGQRFYGEKAEEECKAYEATAEGVMAKRYHECKIKGFTEDHLWPFGNDNDIDVLKIDTEDDLKAINMYLKYTIDKGYNGPLDEGRMMSKEAVGTTQMVIWNYDHDWMKVLGTIDQLLEAMKQHYENEMSQE